GPDDLLDGFGQGGDVQAAAGRRVALDGDTGLGQALGDAGGDAVGQDGAEHRDADGAAERAEEGDRTAGDADLAQRDGVLDDQHEVLHGHADADADGQHVHRDQHQRGLVVDGGQAGEAGQQDDQADDDVGLGAAASGDHPAADGGGDQYADHHRDGQQSGGGGAVAAADLEVLPEEDRAAEHGHADREAGQDGQGGGTAGDDVQRNDRLLDLGLDPGGHGEQQHAAADHGRRLPGQPGELVVDEGDPDEQDADAGGDQGGSPVVDAHVGAAHGRQVQGPGQQHEGDG